MRRRTREMQSVEPSAEERRSKSAIAAAETTTTNVTPPIDQLRAQSGDRTPVLVIVSGPCGTGKTIPLSKPLVVGRSSRADVWIDDEGVSRKHARLERVGEDVVVTDLGSRNGTFRNDERIVSARLKEGDTLVFGNTFFKFAYHDRLDDTLLRSLYSSATKDGLTHVFNHKAFYELLTKEFAFAQRHELPLSVLMIDIDGFKQLNDSFGHRAGDEILVRVAEAIQDDMRAEDIFARYGGDEFVVMLRQTDHAPAVMVADRARKLIEEMSFGPNHPEAHVTVSVGVATYVGKEFNDGEALVQAADERLYRAKRAGKNRVIGEVDVPEPAPTR